MPRVVATCGVIGCSMKHYAKGFCKRHYTQVKRNGRLTPERERGLPKGCAAPSCGAVKGYQRVNGIYYCLKHARQIRAHERLTPEREHAFGHADGCAIPGCDKVYRAKGLCTKHYAEMRWQKLKKLCEAARTLGATIVEAQVVPTAQVPTAQVPTAQVPTAQVPTAQVPTAQVPTV